MNDELKDLLRRINEARSAGDLQNVSDRLGDVLAITGDRSDILAARGNVMLSLGQESSAVDAAWRSIALDPTHDETLKLLGRLQVHSRQSGKELESLPGVPFAKYLMPLDYPPSRRLIPRWGYGRPAHSGLVELFDRNRAHFEKVITELRTLVPFFEKINPVYSQDTASEPGWIGPPVNAIDLALLYYFVWKYRPSTYLEIGSGSTTAFARRAVQDHALSTRIVSIDPEPRSGIDSICDAIVRDGLETLSDFEVFKNLKPGDIVFMDGSHRCFMNSDVTVFFLEVLPLLKPGVVVHIHDIVLPFDYPESFKEWYWNEQYVLAAYLLGMRDRVRILMPSQYVSGTPELRKSLKPQLLPNVGSGGTWLEGGSFWFTLV